VHDFNETKKSVELILDNLSSQSLSGNLILWHNFSHNFVPGFIDDRSDYGQFGVVDKTRNIPEIYYSPFCIY